jgi:hypothetical protein
MKRIAAVLTLAGAAFTFTGPATAQAADCTQNPSIHVTAHVDLNGTTQDVDQCIPG